MSVNGKVYVITGASTGIGAAIAHRLAKNGAKLVLANRSKADGEKLEKELREKCDRPHDFHFISTDTTKKSDVEAMFQLAIDKFGGYDGLVNNAGLGNVPFSLDVTQGQDRWLQTIQVNLIGVMQAARIAMTYWTTTTRPGVIVLSGSIGGHFLHPDTAYGITKSALMYFAHSVGIYAQSFRKFRNVRMVNVAIGMVWTDVWVKGGLGSKEATQGDKQWRDLFEHLGGWTDIEDVAAAFERALVDQSLNGDTLVVTGDRTAGKFRYEKASPIPDDGTFYTSLQFPKGVAEAQGWKVITGGKL